MRQWTADAGGGQDGGPAAGAVGLVAVTAAGRTAAERLAAVWPHARRYDGPAGQALPRAFGECSGVVAFLATGAAVRILAPHLRDKRSEPGVVCVDEGLRFAVALLGGHEGGGNRLAGAVADVLGAVPVVTTASDAVGGTGLDDLAAVMDWRLEPGSDTARVGAALLSGEPVLLDADTPHPLPPLPPHVHVHVRSGGPTAPVPHAPAATTPPDREEEAEPPLLSTQRDRVVSPATGRPAAGTSPHSGELPGADHRPVAVIRVSDRAEDRPGPGTVVFRPQTLIVGVGASRGAPADEIAAAIEQALAGAGLAPGSVAALASVDAKADEPGLLAVARRYGLPLRLHPAAKLAAVQVPHPSDTVRAAVGTPSVAEAAALLAPGGRRGELVVPKTRSTPRPPLRKGGGGADGGADGGAGGGAERPAMATVAVARHRPRGRLAVVGLGPGARDLLPPRAVAELRRAAVVVGLDQYVAQVRDLLPSGARVAESGLGSEQERALGAVRLAAAGHAVALIGSGDAGVYAMASPALEGVGGLDIDVVAVPGITAALASSALLGAPLGHDHVMISLSDLHTPWPVIERRVRAAAEADLVVCFYNPRSRGRTHQLPDALALLAAHRPADTPVGLVRDAERPGQRVILTTLGAVDPDEVDMRTLVVVGAGTTRIIGGRMVTPRGYHWSAEPRHAADCSRAADRQPDRPAAADLTRRQNADAVGEG